MRHSLEMTTPPPPPPTPKSSDHIRELDARLYRQFCTLYNTSRDHIARENATRFRYMCFKMLPFMRHIPLPPIPRKSMYEAILIEFRAFPHIEFILRNAIFRLGAGSGHDWSHTVVCGRDNEPLIRDICAAISPNIRILVHRGTDNMTHAAYSDMLQTEPFWEQFHGEKLLIYQEDSIIFRNAEAAEMSAFLMFDFIGAPFSSGTDDTPNGVGNGGFSLRTKSKMLEVLRTCRTRPFRLGSSTQMYMDYAGLERPPEDVFFSHNMQTWHIGDVADRETAAQFSSEAEFRTTSFGGHKFWASVPSTLWCRHLRRAFEFSPYRPRSDITTYLTYLGKPSDFNLTDKIPNAFDIDAFFFCRANNIEYTGIAAACSHMRRLGLHGFIYHPKQLHNFAFGLSFYSFLSQIFVYCGGEITSSSLMPLNEYVSKHVYAPSIDVLTSQLLRRRTGTLNHNIDTLAVVFVGNEPAGMQLLERIFKYTQQFVVGGSSGINIAVCYNSDKFGHDGGKRVRQYVADHFDFHAVYACREMGTDITPTLLMCDDIRHTHQFTHVLKFHTKNMSDIHQNLTQFLLSMPISDLIARHTRADCHCIGYPEYYQDLYTDVFNGRLKNEHRALIHPKWKFVAGTIFYAQWEVMTAVCRFVREHNYRAYLLNTLYENNSINTTSPIHFLERLFGVIRL